MTICGLPCPHADEHSVTELDPTDAPRPSRPGDARGRRGRHRRGGAAADHGRRGGAPPRDPGRPRGMAGEPGLRRHRQDPRPARGHHEEVPRQAASEAAERGGGQPRGLSLPGHVSAPGERHSAEAAGPHGRHGQQEVQRRPRRRRSAAQRDERLPGGHRRQHRPGRGRHPGGHGQGGPGDLQPAGARHAAADGLHRRLRPQPHHGAHHPRRHRGRQPVQLLPAHGAAADPHRQPRRGRRARRDQPHPGRLAVLRHGPAGETRFTADLAEHQRNVAEAETERKKTAEKSARPSSP